MEGAYTTVRSLGRGGFGQTFLVTDAAGRPLVRKVSRAGNPAQIDRQHRALTDAAAIGSPYFVRPVDLAADRSYLVMEYLDGYSTLHAILRRRRLPSEDVRRAWARHLIEAIRLLHRHRIAHGDIKPLNIMVRETDASLRLIDFGLACTPRTCADKTFAGTYCYMPPEWIQRRRGRFGFEQTRAYDIWATGLTVLSLANPDGNPIFEIYRGAPWVDQPLLLQAHRTLVARADDRVRDFVTDAAVRTLVMNPNDRRL